MNNHFKQLHCLIIDNVDNEFCQSNSYDQLPDNGNLGHNPKNNLCNVALQDQLIQHNPFFKDEIGKKNDGVCGLIARAFQLNNNSRCKTSFDEAQFHMDVCQFLIHLSITKQYRFLRILNSSHIINFTNTRIPRSLDDVRAYYLSNKHSIIENIPIPEVFEYDNHACVSIKSIVTHMLALQQSVSLLKSSSHSTISVNNTSLLNVPKTKEILQEVNDTYRLECDPYVLFIVIWSDDFEVNITRKNKSSTWLKTITFVSNDKTKETAGSTQAICLGSKKLNHDKVNQKFNNELEAMALPTLFYVKQFQQSLPIVVRVLVMSADRPERNSLNDLLSHNGNSSKRWMYSSMIDPYKLASCPGCYHKRLLRLYTMNDSFQESTNTCRKCCDFDYENSSYNMNTFPIPYNHPYTKTNLSFFDDKTFEEPYTNFLDIKTRQKINSIRLNYDFLNKGFKYAMYHNIKESWTKSETVVFLKLMCIKESFIHKSIDTLHRNTKIYDNIVDAVNMTPAPPMWSSIITLDQFIDTPMHQLFEGIVKSGIELIMQFFKHHRKWTKFAAETNCLLENVKSLRLGFCKCETFTNDEDYKTGGWLAESYLGFS